MKKFLRIAFLAAAAYATAASTAGVAAEPLKIGYCDWPSWAGWQIAIDKGWFKQEGVDVSFVWFDYAGSLDAFQAGKLDGDMVAMSDALALGSGGRKSTMIMLSDYSNGNDMIIGKPGIKKIADLKGKKVGVEFGLLEQLLLLDGMHKAGLTDSDVTLVNTKTSDAAEILASGQVDAVGAFQPNAGQTLERNPGSRAIYTSADQPGLIYDGLAVDPHSLSSRRDDWKKVLKVWDRVVHYVNDPATHADAVKIMSTRVGLTPPQFEPLLNGLKILDTARSRQYFVNGSGYQSLYGSTKLVNDFSVKYGVYKTSQDITAYIDPSLVNGK